MAVQSALVSGTGKVLLAQNQRSPQTVQGQFGRLSFSIHTDSTGPFRVGGSEVSSTVGYPWNPTNGDFQVDLDPGESFYAYATSQTDFWVLSGGR